MLPSLPAPLLQAPFLGAPGPVAPAEGPSFVAVVAVMILAQAQCTAAQHLAIELLERMFAEGVKVVCLDLTNQYAQELSAFYDSEGEATCLDRIRASADKDRDKVDDSRSKGGSFENLKNAIDHDIVAFLTENCESKLKIYNPAQLSASI